MPPRRRGTSGYRGVRARSSDTFYSEIRSGEMRLVLGTFNTAEEAACAFDAAVWRLNKPRREMKFLEVMTMELAQNLAPRPWIVTDEDRCRNRRPERRLSIAKIDEHAMEAWRRQFPQESSTSANSLSKGGRRGRRRGRSNPPIMKIDGDPKGAGPTWSWSFSQGKASVRGRLGGEAGPQECGSGGPVDVCGPWARRVAQRFVPDHDQADRGCGGSASMSGSGGRRGWARSKGVVCGELHGAEAG
ncbi:Ethylene-responsive transcription factor CRF1 [Hordeum vulgare]|nr:Ethylene-responsive transcription factor CRF1 [Hordeum vulgare]